MKLRAIDLFAGIGGFRIALNRNDFRTVFSSEWNRSAQRSYTFNFGDRPAGDIRIIPSEAIPAFNLLTAGFPCQPFSIAGVTKKNSIGKKHGFEDETQGTLFFEIARIIRDHRPDAILLENVKNLISHNTGRTFAVILQTLEDLGYHLFTQVIDARHFVPQHRERTYIVGFRKEFQLNEFCTQFQSSFQHDLFSAAPKLSDILESSVDPQYTLTDTMWSYLQAYKEKHQAAGNGFGFGIAPLDGVTRTLSARYYKDGSEILIEQPGQNPRRLTPRECARLMGFPEDYIIAVSDTESYKQFGNSVVVPVVELLIQAIRTALEGIDPQK